MRNNRVNNKRKKIVIVGGGTAGIVIANNLQENFDVDVLEKSDNKDYPFFYKIPLMIGLVFRNINTTYISKRDVKICNERTIPFFESNVLGGASVINGCVHMVGSKQKWERILSKFGFCYDDLILSYNRMYSNHLEDKGKITLSNPPGNIIDDAFIKALNASGIPSGDVNFSNSESCGRISVTVKKIIRSSVMSLVRRKSFMVHCGEKVEKLLFDEDGNSSGVVTDKRTICSDYVIVSAGVVGSCDLILRTKMQQKSNASWKNLVVGQGVQDHTNLRVNVKTNKKIGSLNEITKSSYQKSLMLLRHLLGKSTIMVSTGASSAAHLDLDNDGIIDTRIQIVQFSETGRHGSDGKYFGEQSGFSISITAIHPESRGQIYLKNDSNVIDPNFLASEKDIDLLKKALRYCLQLLKTKPLSDHVLGIDDEKDMLLDPETYIINNIFSGHHLNGGLHEAVNENFEITSSNGLFVCDASIFGEYAASNIHSSVVLMADMFSKKFQLFHS